MEVFLHIVVGLLALGIFFFAGSMVLHGVADKWFADLSRDINEKEKK